MSAILKEQTLPYPTFFIYLAIGFGSMILSWMNDSGFWVIGRLSGFTERETLRTWTPLAFSMCCFGLIQTVLLSKLLPFGG